MYPPNTVRSSSKDFVSFIINHEVRYVIAENESMQRNRYRGGIDRRLQFEGILEFDDKHGIVEVKIPDNWRKVKADTDGSVDFIVFATY